jgi:hypothetical protein
LLGPWRRKAQGTDINLCGGHAGESVGGLPTGDRQGSGDGHLSPQGHCSVSWGYVHRESWKGGSGNESSLSMEALWREPGGGSFSRKSEGYEEGSGKGHFSIRAQLGNMERGSFTGDFQRWIRRLSLSVRGTGGPSAGKLENLLKEGSGYGASLSMDLLGELGWGLLCWGPCRLWKEGSGDRHLHGVSVGQPGVG